jgi:hypothetical protein
MLLTPQEADLFVRLHRALMFFVNQRLRVLPDEPVTPEEFGTLPPEARLQVRQALIEHPALLDSFRLENPAQLDEEELATVASWRHHMAGKFMIFRALKKYTVFLSTMSPTVAYGVVALTQPLEQLVGPHLPVMVDAVLLPFKDKSIYDSLLSGYGMSFGPGIRRMFNESYQRAKDW